MGTEGIAPAPRLAAASGDTGPRPRIRLMDTVCGSITVPDVTTNKHLTALTATAFTERRTAHPGLIWWEGFSILLAGLVWLVLFVGGIHWTQQTSYAHQDGAVTANTHVLANANEVMGCTRGCPEPREWVRVNVPQMHPASVLLEGYVSARLAPGDVVTVYTDGNHHLTLQQPDLASRLAVGVATQIGTGLVTGLGLAAAGHLVVAARDRRRARRAG